MAQNKTVKEILEYLPGAKCECFAHSENECGCDTDWTSKEIYELRWKLNKAIEYLELVPVSSRPYTYVNNDFKQLAETSFTVYNIKNSEVEVNPLLKPYL